MTLTVNAIAMVGLGRLGAPIAACLAAVGYRVIGVDTNRKTIDAINAKQPPVYEPGLEDKLAEAADRLTATEDLSHAIQNTDASFVLVPTPSEPNGAFSLDYVLAACEEIGEALRHRTTPHLVTIVSTVMPGDTQGPIRHTLERASGLRCGVDFHLCYSPEFVALGSVIHDYLHPDTLLIGESDPVAGHTLATIHRRVVNTDPPVSRMTFVNAEIAKIAVNAYVTTKITFANTIAGICERLLGADADTVTNAIGLDSRIGRKYLRGGFGYGGPCFPRDNAALAHTAASIGADPALPQTIDAVNRRQVDRLFNRLSAILPDHATIAMLGLAYKPNSNVTDESQPVALAEQLARAGHTVRAFDPAAQPNNIAFTLCDSAEDAMNAADAVVLATPWPGMANAITHAATTRPLIVFDPWRALIDHAWPPGTTYLPAGHHTPETSSTQAHRLAG
ncbi:MAG: nucleotide sugar dehydrogenase [Phycisphaeraceae bacterium]